MPSSHFANREFECVTTYVGIRRYMLAGAHINKNIVNDTYVKESTGVRIVNGHVTDIVNCYYTAAAAGSVNLVSWDARRRTGAHGPTAETTIDHGREPEKK